MNCSPEVVLEGASYFVQCHAMLRARCHLAKIQLRQRNQLADGCRQLQPHRKSPMLSY